MSKQPAAGSNAVHALAMHLDFAALRRLAARPHRRFDGDLAPVRGLPAREAVCARYGASLVELLNACTSAELAEVARALGLTIARPSPTALREALWAWGAAHEAGGDPRVTPALQPVPLSVAGRLVIHAAPRGLFPPAAAWPRPLPAPRAAEPPVAEPDDVDDLLAAATRALGVPLGDRGRDKGAWGVRAAALLGVPERGADEPDWRGDVELKTVPVAADARGRWRVREDPAISMLGAAPLAKLARVLWLVRAEVPGGATLLSWYLLEGDGADGALVGRYLHTRPKGPAGTADRGWYLHRRFFAEAGLLATLNGW